MKTAKQNKMAKTNPKEAVEQSANDEATIATKQPLSTPAELYYLAKNAITGELVKFSLRDWRGANEMKLSRAEHSKLPAEKQAEFKPGVLIWTLEQMVSTDGTAYTVQQAAELFRTKQAKAIQGGCGNC